MGWEIERKFLIERLPGDITRTKPVSIIQGYLILCRNGPELRIRSIEKRYYLTIKGEGSLRRKEIETEITKAPFKSLWPHTVGKRIEKRRYSINYGSQEIIIDEFAGKYTGLMIAEIEFPNEKQALEFDPPPWFGKEITHNSKYRNRNMAC
ncbi:MAG: CYTH domain-containing protein [Bacteroidetes bacterium]|nr:CYTH domain-containing protein [Bacteroidota bacterium]